MDGVLWVIDAVTREAMLFAGVGLLSGGLVDLLIDAVFLLRRIWRGGPPRRALATLPAPRAPGRIAVFVPAWDEVAVIGGMLTAALDRFAHPDYRILVGLYPNDPATVAAAAAIAKRDGRVRLVIGERDGPTTKADCLNTLWRALVRADLAEGVATKAIVIHDAEDVVHPAELTAFDALIEDHAVVQLPVLPLVKRGSRFVSGHYADEFAEAHLKQLVVRTALGAGMPLAGTGFAIRPAILAQLANRRGGDPFDADSLVEDYELGLRIAELGGRSLFARIGDGAGGVVAVRAYFPADIDAAVRQKARWMTGIALAGWDRIGWARPRAIGDHWMRMRDRRALIAVLVLAAAYVALVGWGLGGALGWWLGAPRLAPSPALATLLAVNAGLLGWRMLVRAAVTARVYDMREALWSMPRLLVGNYVALLAARRALWRYVGMLRGAAVTWDKTRHEFPDLAERPA